MAGLAAAVALAVGSGCEPKITDEDIAAISLPELRRLMDRQSAAADGQLLLLIDPRSPARYAEGHLPGAMNMQITAVPLDAGRDPAIEAYRHKVVYGDDPTSAAARAMAKRLLDARYRGVRMFMGGLREWREAGLPIEQTPQPGDSEPPSSPAAPHAGQD